MIIFNTITLGTHNTNKAVKVIISGNNFVRVHFVLFVCLDSFIRVNKYSVILGHDLGLKCF